MAAIYPNLYVDRNGHYIPIEEVAKMDMRNNVENYRQMVEDCHRFLRNKGLLEEFFQYIEGYYDNFTRNDQI